jgi:hypothetical protein
MRVSQPDIYFCWHLRVLFYRLRAPPLTRGRVQLIVLVIAGNGPQRKHFHIVVLDQTHRKHWSLPLLRVYPLLSNGYKQRFHCSLLTYSVHVTLLLLSSSSSPSSSLPSTLSLVVGYNLWKITLIHNPRIFGNTFVDLKRTNILTNSKSAKT